MYLWSTLWKMPRLYHFVERIEVDPAKIKAIQEMKPQEE